MPYADVRGARLFYQDVGAGPPVITLHGFSETSDYWHVRGFADLLAPHLRVIALDLRGHGRTLEDPARPGFDVETLADDIEGLAEALGLQNFHLLAHATGSVVALRYAMRRPTRLGKVVVTSAASATQMAPAEFFRKLVAFYASMPWSEILPRLRRRPEPFLNGLAAAANSDLLWAAIETVFQKCEPARLSAFAQAFYSDTDPQLARLGQVSAEILVVSAELDKMMLGPSKLIVEHAPNARSAFLPDVGHMTALEHPEALSMLVLGFLRPDLASCHDF